MAVELATAYVSIVADTGKLAPSIMKGTSGLDSSLNRRGSSIGSSLMKGIGGAAVAGAAVVAAGTVATLGVALAKGFNRLRSLENATAKLEGLGHSAESVQQIMDDSLAAVKGTAFGMDEAAATAASAVAAGVKPGAELQRTLSLVADASTIAGTSMGDMGAIFNKVAGTGKIQGEVIAQLGERGIPILQLLADEMGVSAEEVGKLASAGEIDFARFQNAMEKGMGGAALKSGETFDGAMANMQASLGRIGAGLLGGVFGGLAPAITNITNAMAPLEDSAARFGETLGEIITLIQVGFTGNLMEEDSFLPLDVVQRAMGFGEVLKTIFDAMKNIDFSPFIELAGYLSPIGLAFKVLQPILPLVIDALGQIATVIGGALGQVLQAVLPIMSNLVLLLADGLATIIPILLPIITTLAGVISSVLLAVLPLLDPLFQLIQAILPILVGIIQVITPLISGWADALGTILIPIIDTLVAVLGGLITFLTGVFTGNWEMAWQGIQDIFTGIFEGIVNIGKGVINGLIDLINGLTGGLNEVGNFVSDISGGAIDFTIGKIPHLADGATVMPRRGGTLAVLAEAGRAESVVDTGLMNRALQQGLAGSGSGSQVRMDVHPAPGMSEETIGRIAAERLAFELRGA